MSFHSQSKGACGRSSSDDSDGFDIATGSAHGIEAANNDISAATGYTTSLQQFIQGGERYAALTRSEATQKPLGSTILAELGKKYQVDQSVNL
jgi:hypothetical protein